MQTLEGLKKRIKTTSSLKDIVSSMKTLSAVSVGQYEKSTFALGVYAETIYDGLQAVLRSAPVNFGVNKVNKNKVIAIVLGSDQGLVGKFNKSIFEYAKNYFKENDIRSDDLTLIVAGRSLASKILAQGYDINTLFSMPSSVKVMIAVTKKIVLRLNELKIEEEDRENSIFNLGLKVLIFYNKKNDSASFVQDVVQILPIDKEFLDLIKSREWGTKNIPMFTSSSGALLSSLIRQLLFVNIYRAISQSLSAEHFTRMMTMQNAEKNIDDHLEIMNLEYQQRRQTEITSELLDVVSGAEVLNKKRKV